MNAINMFTIGSVFVFEGIKASRKMRGVLERGMRPSRGDGYGRPLFDGDRIL